MPASQSSCDPAATVDRLEGLIGREHVSADYVRFRIAVLRAQTAARDALSSAAEADAGPQQRGPTPLGPDDVLWDRRLLAGLLEDLSRATEQRGHRSEDLVRLSAAAAEAPQMLESLAVKAAFGPDEGALGRLAERLEISFDALLFFGRVLATPFVTETVGRRKRQGSVPSETSGRCPSCGSPPAVARLVRGKDREGKRVLCCPLCGESWEFARVDCPLCGHCGELDRLSAETDTPYSIEACRQCRGYLKTVDQRRLPEENDTAALVETTATLYLDLIAEAKGLARGLPYTAMR